MENKKEEYNFEKELGRGLKESQFRTFKETLEFIEKSEKPFCLDFKIIYSDLMFIHNILDKEQEKHWNKISNFNKKTKILLNIDDLINKIWILTLFAAECNIVCYTLITKEQGSLVDKFKKTYRGKEKTLKINKLLKKWCDINNRLIKIVDTDEAKKLFDNK